MLIKHLCDPELLELLLRACIPREPASHLCYITHCPKGFCQVWNCVEEVLVIVFVFKHNAVLVRNRTGILSEQWALRRFKSHEHIKNASLHGRESACAKGLVVDCPKMR